MLLERHLSGAGLSPVPDRVGLLNARYRHHGAVAVLEHALSDPDLGRVALVSSFGAESVVLLHLVSVVAPQTPVLFVDTRMLFPETLAYQRDLADRLDLRDVRVIRAGHSDLAAADPADDLHRRDTDGCCGLRKTLPLEHALTGFDAWITGRKRYQASTRAALDFFEEESGTRRIKVNPLAHWGKEDVAEYILNNRLPRHPLIAQGYPSIGCAPCTSAVAPGEDERAGRWRGSDKTECGIHFIDGRMVRVAQHSSPVAAEAEGDPHTAEPAMAQSSTAQSSTAPSSTAAAPTIPDSRASARKDSAA